MAQLLWLHIDGGLLMAVGDYVLTGDVNVDMQDLITVKHGQPS